MTRQVAVALVITLGLANAAQAQTQLSGARVGSGLAAVVAGVVMMAMDPEQPAQPGAVSNDTLTQAVLAEFDGLTPATIREIRGSVGAAVLRCEPFCPGDVDRAIADSFAVGAGAGIGVSQRVMAESGWVLHEGAFQPFEERSAALKYGGAALVVGGGLMLALWSHVPALEHVDVRPSLSGVTVGMGW